MNRLPSLDDYDLSGVRLDEAALWGDDVRYLVEARSDGEAFDGFTIDTL
ncbi:hypothetical protein SAM23877_6162 [Streptomyces ambofaciens ATCC 23877]|uniref:Uncharacterized protein n=1 Tax=Streptomyces ambofaciens (strain ATCC 23877 / 3486 / DSM 40053 / JCM 4204 / NBRC 12836 / NRRL B-2516) TaxID=278992 RepID=A0A0K2B289_STRA7|nr:hypothetical protein [Streptomyces ambofaciens]AKZ59207.1 hypothetical protein SAM23877_6162 [Streptomyces ambofaciens ATCC 23877]WNA15400.1 hypothetical protein SAMYPH_69 [Streptomyces phage Samy]